MWDGGVFGADWAAEVGRGVWRGWRLGCRRGGLLGGVVVRGGMGRGEGD